MTTIWNEEFIACDEQRNIIAPSKLIEAVRNKSVDQVTSALKECPDLPSVLNAALLESVLGGNDKIRELIMNSYSD